MLRCRSVVIKNVWIQVAPLQMGPHHPRSKGSRENTCLKKAIDNILNLLLKELIKWRYE